MVAVCVVPVSWVSQGGLEHTCWRVPAFEVVAVLVVPVSCVSQGGLEQVEETAVAAARQSTSVAFTVIVVLVELV